MVGLERHPHLAELFRDVAARRLQPSACQLGDDLLPGAAGHVDTRSGGLPDGCERLLECRALPCVGDVQPRSAVQIVGYGLDAEDAVCENERRHLDLQTVSADGCRAVKRRVARYRHAVDRHVVQQAEPYRAAYAHDLRAGHAYADRLRVLYRRYAFGCQKTCITTFRQLGGRPERRRLDAAA